MSGAAVVTGAARGLGFEIARRLRELFPIGALMTLHFESIFLGPNVQLLDEPGEIWIDYSARQTP